MDPLDHHHLAGRSRYDPLSPPPSQIPNPNHYPYPSRHDHHHHPDASFPPPPPPLPPGHHQHHHQPQWDERNRRSDDDRFYPPYPHPHPADPFLPPPPPHPRFQDRLAPPEEHYVVGRPPHRSGQEEFCTPEQPWGRHDFAADRFRDGDGWQQLGQLRWEDEEERRRVSASYRDDSYSGNALEKKRFRWASPDFRWDSGGSNMRCVDPFDGDEMYKEPSMMPPYPSPPPLRVPRNVFAHERDQQIGSIDQRRLPPTMLRSAIPRSDRYYMEDRREEIGPVGERQLQPILFSDPSYSDRTMETFQRDVNNAHDSPAEYRYGVGSDYSSQEGYLMNNRSKRRMAIGGKDYNEVPVTQKQAHSPMKQTAKRLSALSRLQSGKSVWNRIQQKPSNFPSSFPDKHQLEVGTLDTSLKYNTSVSSTVVPSNSTQPSSYTIDPDTMSPKKRKRSLVEKRENVVIPIVSGTLFSETNHGIAKRPASKTSQNNPASLGKTGSSSSKPANDVNLQSFSKNMTGKMMTIKTEKRTFKSVICGGEEVSNSDTKADSEMKNSVDTTFETCKQQFLVAEELVEDNTDQATEIGNLRRSESIGHSLENYDAQFREKDCLDQEIPVSAVLSSDENISESFVQKKSDEIVVVAQALSNIILADNIIDEDDLNHEKFGKDLNNREGHEHIANSFASSPNKSSSSPRGTYDEFASFVGCRNSNPESDYILPENIEHTREIYENQQSEAMTIQEELKTIDNVQDGSDCGFSHLDVKGILIDFPSNDRDMIIDLHPQVRSMDKNDGAVIEQVNVKLPQSDYSQVGEENLTPFSPSDSLSRSQKSDSSIFSCGIHEGFHSTDPISSPNEFPSDDACTENTFGTKKCGDYGLKMDPLLSVSSLVMETEEDNELDKIPLSSENMLDQIGMAQFHEPKRDTVIESKALGSENLKEKSALSFKASKGLPSHVTRKAVPLGGHLRNRTWHRNCVPSSTSTSNIDLQHSGGDSLSKQSLKKSVKMQSSYVRKGNSLIRKPATESPHLKSSNSLDASGKLQKHVSKGTMKFEQKGNNSRNLSCYNHTFERPKTPPLPIGTNSSNSIADPSHNTSHPVYEDAASIAENNVQLKPLESISAFGDDKKNSVSKLSDPPNSRMTYVKHKSNQLVAALGPKPGNLPSNSSARAQLLSSFTSSDLYYRKNKNQLVRDASSSDSQTMQEFIPLSNVSVDDQRASTASSFSRRGSITFMKIFDKARQKAKKYATFSHVWTLNGETSQKKSLKLLDCRTVLPYLVPWKRTVYRAKTLSTLKRRPLSLIGQKLQLIRKRSRTYRLSRDGFPLPKTGGNSLKWSRSSERQSKRANQDQEAELSVADVQRQIIEKKNFTSACVDEKNDDRACTDKEVRVDGNRSLIPSRPVGNYEYIRIGNGNKLVRDPKKLVRILASEKVRWSLHTARLRLARKRQYCQFFTRFGQCNKKDGRCPYVHDSAKIAICTKFLRGSCSDANCKLTHKVIPERMPDCSYFLQGLCTNTSCPYRHVNVNSKAPVCEGFLKGYCADGDECRKKHSYECTHFKATGNCPQGSKCKFHHPKGTTTKFKKRKIPEIQGNNGWGRYFDYSISEAQEPLHASTDRHHSAQVEELCSDDQVSDYISLNISSDDEDSTISNVPMDSHEEQAMIDRADTKQDEIDARIKPIRIMRKDYSVGILFGLPLSSPAAMTMAVAEVGWKIR